MTLPAHGAQSDPIAIVRAVGVLTLDAPQLNAELEAALTVVVDAALNYASDLIDGPTDEDVEVAWRAIHEFRNPEGKVRLDKYCREMARAALKDVFAARRGRVA